MKQRKLIPLDETIGVFRTIKDLGMTPYGDSNKIRRVAIFECMLCNKETTMLVQSASVNQSCGCTKLEAQKKSSTKHGLHKSRVYNIWKGMRSRVNSPKTDYEKEVYGKLYVATEWSDFLTFKKWSDDNGYADNLQIDRKNNSKGYEPSNCRWITKAENTQNRLKGRRNRELPKGVSQSSKNSFASKITIDKRVFRLGSFSTVKGAMNRYNEFIKLNGLESTYPLSTL